MWLEYPRAMIVAIQVDHFGYIFCGWGFGTESHISDFCARSGVSRRYAAPCIPGLRECASDVGVHVFLVGELDNEDNVVLRFEGRDDSAVAGFVGNGFAVDGGDNRGLA
jgi:hypothetical protein